MMVFALGVGDETCSVNCGFSQKQFVLIMAPPRPPG